MTTLDRAQRAATPAAPSAWRTRDIIVTAVIGVVFGIVFAAWNLVWSVVAPASAVAPIYAFLIYGVWLVPAVLAPLIVRKPGAAVFAEMVAAGVSTLLGSPWGPDVLLSGDHGRIRRWRRKEALRATRERRPDLLQKAPLSAEDADLLARLGHRQGGAEAADATPDHDDVDVSL